jgi:hypothetical protein
MNKILIGCAAALALGACASAGDLKVSLDSLVGQPVQRAVDRLGPPAAQSDDSDGGKTYVWESNYDVQYSTSQPTSTLGVKDPNDVAGATTPGAQATSSEATNYRCFVRVTTGGDGLIKTTAWGGNGDGCAAYASRLR